LNDFLGGVPHLTGFLSVDSLGAGGFASNVLDAEAVLAPTFLGGTSKFLLISAILLGGGAGLGGWVNVFAISDIFLGGGGASWGFSF